MTEAAITLQGQGELHLAGVLDYRSGAALRKQGQALIKGCEAAGLVVDCSAVQKSSSVGLSLLLCLMRDAASAGKGLKVQGMPLDMRQIAEVSGLTALLIQD